jgi:hypothetical protein
VLEGGASQLLLPVRIELVFEGILPANHSFHGGERLILFLRGSFSEVEESNVYLKRKPSVLEASASSTLFGLRVELVLNGILPANQSFQSGENQFCFK